MTGRFRRPTRASTRRRLASIVLGTLTVAAPAATADPAATGQYVVMLKDTTTASADLATRPGS